MLDSLDGQISDAMQAITIDAVLPEAEPRSGSTVSAPPETSLEGVPADIQAWLRGRCRVALAKIVENNRPRIAAMARRRAASPKFKKI